ncbi:MAG: hypothetical protein ACE5GW_14290 [Planctomycetota bacterium]
MSPLLKGLLLIPASLALLTGSLLASPDDHKSHRLTRVKKKVHRQERAHLRRQKHGQVRRDERRHVRRHRRDRWTHATRGPRFRHEYRHFRSHDRRYRRSDCGLVEVWRDGYYKTVVEKVREPGYYERVWVPSCRPTVRVGRLVRLTLGGGYYKKVWREGRLRTVKRRVWVPGSFVIETACSHH